MIIRKNHLPINKDLLNCSIDSKEQINSTYLHIQNITNLRSFKWIQRFKVYNFKPQLYKFSVNSVLYFNFVKTWDYIISLFKSIGILITKIKYSFKSNFWEIRFGYYLSFYKKSNILKNSKVHYLELIDPIENNNNNTLAKVTALISNYLNSNVKLVVHKLHARWEDNSIILETLGYYSLKKTLGKLIWRFFAKGQTYNKKLESDSFPISPGNLTGLFIKVAGRSFRVKLTNRKLTAKYEKGRYAKKNALLTDTSKLLRINKYGTFTITSTTAHTI